jgi:hypothetical protein
MINKGKGVLDGNLQRFRQIPAFYSVFLAYQGT